MQTYEISLDMKKAPGRIERTVTVRRGDNDTQRVEASITAGGQPYAPRGAARLDIMHADGTWARCSASVSGSTAACTLPSEALNGTGRCRAAHFVFTDGAKVESTEGFALVIEGNVDANGTPGAQGYDDELEAMKAAWREFSAQAERDEAERRKAEESRKAEETKRADAESKRAQAETARATAETARADAEASRVQAETERAEAESARKQAEIARASSEDARKTAEAARADAEAKRAQAEGSRKAEESKRVQTETARASEESKRAAEEGKRVQAETERKKGEDARRAEESKRANAESARAQAEAGRASKESERVTAETARAQAETARAEAERGRSTAETARAEAETARAAAQAKNNADQALNNEQMKKLSPVILQAGQYDPSTLTPTVTGEPNRVYFVPMVAPAAIELYDLTAKQVEAGNLYVEWMWVGGKWEQMGQSEMKAKPITTEQVDAVFAGAHPTGDSVLNLTGLDYVRTKEAALLDGKADASHAHTAGDITSGTLDPARVPVLPTAKVDGLQAALDGKQPRGEYAAKAHTHAVADVDGLQAALDGKANASHRHVAADIDGLDAAVGGVKVVRTDKRYPDGHDKDGFYVTLKDTTDPMYPAYLASQGIVLFQSGIAMWKNGRISTSGTIYFSGPVRGCTARFGCSGSGLPGNGGTLSFNDGGFIKHVTEDAQSTACRSMRIEVSRLLVNLPSGNEIFLNVPIRDQYDSLACMQCAYYAGPFNPGGRVAYWLDLGNARIDGDGTVLSTDGPDYGLAGDHYAESYMATGWRTETSEAIVRF